MTRRYMPKSEARKLHAHFDAAGRLGWIIPVFAFATFLAMGWSFPDSVALLGAAIAFVGIAVAISVDTMSKRIPNNLSLTVLASGPIWWLGYALGSPLPALPVDGIVMDMMGTLYGVSVSGAVLPMFDTVSYPMRIGLDLAMMVVVFVPLYFSWSMGLGFGGGDVKLMTAAAPFFGWPLGMDFFFLTFLIGGVLSVCVILGRMFSRAALKAGVKSERLATLSTLREFPFAPAIGAAAIVCFAIKLQGLN